MRKQAQSLYGAVYAVVLQSRCLAGITASACCPLRTVCVPSSLSWHAVLESAYVCLSFWCVEDFVSELSADHPEDAEESACAVQAVTRARG